MTVWITSGNRPSSSRVALQRAAGFRKARFEAVQRGDWLINWGCSNLPVTGDCRHLQAPLAVHYSSNKLKAFELMTDRDVNCVPWTSSLNEAQAWSDDDKTVVARTTLTGHSGNGIIIYERGSEIEDAPLYTKYIFKEREYRVHVVKDQVIDTQRKIRDPDRTVIDWKVRSHANGFIFARNNITDSDRRNSLAVAAVRALELDFGAVDIVEDKHGELFVLEVNTAPGLEGQTVDRYARALRAACS